MLPFKLKSMALFDDGVRYAGEVPEITLPKLSRKLEEYRGGGMDGPVQFDMGQEAIEMEWKPGGHLNGVYTAYGLPAVDGKMLRFVGGYQADDTGQVKAVEIVVRGRHTEIDPGTAKPGDNSEQTIKTSCTYYKQVVDGVTLIEIDILNYVFIVNGVDRLAALRAAIGG